VLLLQARVLLALQQRQVGDEAATRVARRDDVVDEAALGSALQPRGVSAISTSDGVSTKQRQHDRQHDEHNYEHTDEYNDEHNDRQHDDEYNDERNDEHTDEYNDEHNDRQHDRQHRTIGFANVVVYSSVRLSTSLPRKMISTAPLAPMTAISADGQLHTPRADKTHTPHVNHTHTTHSCRDTEWRRAHARDGRVRRRRLRDGARRDTHA
jgi:hypothetical protein